jgi:hypothetical protein
MDHVNSDQQLEEKLNGSRECYLMLLGFKIGKKFIIWKGKNKDEG